MNERLFIKLDIQGPDLECGTLACGRVMPTGGVGYLMDGVIYCSVCTEQRIKHGTT